MRNAFIQVLARFLQKHPILSVVLIVTYVILPFDLIPEALVGPLGYIDDLIVVVVPALIAYQLRKKRNNLS